MFAVNAMGSKILELFHTGLDETQIAAQLSAACRADLEHVRTDVHEFLEALDRHHILSKGLPGHK